ncbi:MAG: 3-phosphoglycerate dehydrogenase family protein [Gammaproteobacteria bacterium]|nr:3-phosphoglycerate dehydrogenase family protein [Gammaproteobacteria bacterium]
MYKIKTYNNISDKGLSRLPTDQYTVGESIDQPDAIMLRSAKLHDEPIADSVRAIGRAGAGVNNIPVDKMSERGVVVFNAPGANANAVKELVIVGMLMAARNICDAWQYSENLQGTDAEVSKAVEAGKKQYVGFELPGRTLGVIGLGAIGVEVANAAVALGMNVIGFDPTITIKRAWQLSADVKEMESAEALLNECDFVTFHVPLIESTKNLLNASRLKTMKNGVVVMNFARDGIVDDDAVLAGIESGKVGAYVSDFPSPKLQGKKRVYTLPHLGASTNEAEDNCAIMIADQLKDFLQNGHIKNAVNFPDVKLSRKSEHRLAIANLNRPDMVAQISHVLGEASVNILHMINDSRADLAYTLIDVESPLSADSLQNLSDVDGVLSVRAL